MTTSPQLTTESSRNSIPKRLLFTREEYVARTRATQERMAQANLDAIVVHQPENIAWLTGFWHDGFFAYHSVVIGRTGEPRLVIRALENPVAEELSWVDERYMWWDGEDPLTYLLEAVDAATGGRGRVGLEFDSSFLSLDRFHSLGKSLEGYDLVSSERIVESLQQIKSPAEIEYVRQAGRIVSAAVAAGIEAIQVGSSEQDVAAAVATAQALNGHDGFMGGLGGTICTGWRTLQLHGQQYNREIESGDRFRLELGGIYKQYWAKQMRAGMVGPVDASVLRATDIIREAQDEGIKRMGPGVNAREVASACREPLLAAGLVERYDNRVGYGLGIQFHPTSGDFSLDIDARSDYELKPGMVFHMLLFAGGAAMSETVVVTENGHEILTANPRITYSKGA